MADNVTAETVENFLGSETLYQKFSASNQSPFRAAFPGMSPSLWTEVLRAANFGARLSPAEQLAFRHYLVGVAIGVDQGANASTFADFLEKSKPPGLSEDPVQFQAMLVNLINGARRGSDAYEHTPVTRENPSGEVFRRVLSEAADRFSSRSDPLGPVTVSRWKHGYHLDKPSPDFANALSSAAGKKVNLLPDLLPGTPKPQHAELNPARERFLSLQVAQESVGLNRRGGVII